MAANTQHHLDCYAKEGLRTLCFTKKVPDPYTTTFPGNIFCSTIRLPLFYYLHALMSVCVCVRVLQVVTEAALKSWSETRREALAAIEHREELVRESAAELETDLTILGNNTQYITYKQNTTAKL